MQTIHEIDPITTSSPIVATIPYNTNESVSVTTDYIGNKVYENGELKYILINGGYYDMNQEKYFFYITDHLGE